MDWGDQILRDLVDAMEDNTGGSGTQYIQGNSTNEGSLVADADNQGTIEKIPAKCDMWGWVRNGVLTLECTDETLGSAQLTATFYDSDNSVNLSGAESTLTLKAQWLSRIYGIKLGFKATYTEANAGGSVSASDFSSWYSEGEDDSNSDEGTWYMDYTNSTKLIELYKDSAKDSADLVASGTWDGTPGSSVTLAAQNGSGLTVTVQVDSDPGGDGTLEVTINSPKLKDRWYIDYTNDKDCVWDEFLGKKYQFEFPTSGDKEIPQALAERS